MRFMTAPSAAPLSKVQTFLRRTSSTVFLWALVTGVFVSGWVWAFLGMIGLLILIATIEYFQMIRADKLPCFPRFGVFCALAYCTAQYIPLTQGKLPHSQLDVVAVSAVAIGSFILQLRYKIVGINSLLAVAVNLLGFVYIAIMFNFAVKILFLPQSSLETPGHLPPASAFILLWLIAVTKFTDMGAYLTGSLIGRNKMIPHISPGKTWEGFVGGLFFAQLAGFGLFMYFPNQLAILSGPTHVAVLGLIMAILAVVGDLAESVVKRSLRAKDSGHMLPGIGGSLDLIDSICFTAPALYLYIRLVILPTA